MLRVGLEPTNLWYIRPMRCLLRQRSYFVTIFWYTFPTLFYKPPKRNKSSNNSNNSTTAATRPNRPRPHGTISSASSHTPPHILACVHTSPRASQMPCHSRNNSANLTSPTLPSPTSLYTLFSNMCNSITKQNKTITTKIPIYASS